MALPRKTAISKQESQERRSRGRPRHEDLAAIDRALLEVALKEFLQHGYGGTSMSQIVKVAGISKTTLYSRYSSKESLFRAIIHSQIDRLDPAPYLRSGEASFGLEEGLISFANKMLEISLHGDLLGVNRLILSESYRFPELGAAAAERTAMGIKRIEKFIRSCADSEKKFCKDPSIAAEIFILMMRGWYVDVILTNKVVSDDTRDQWVRRAVHVLISTRKDW